AWAHGARRPRPGLPPSAAAGRLCRHGRTEHRLCHRRPRTVHRTGPAGAREAGGECGGAAMNPLVFDIGQGSDGDFVRRPTAINQLVVDIAPVPDVAFGRRALGLDGLPDAEVAKAMMALRRQRTGSDFLPLEQQRVVAIACLLRRGDTLKLWSLGDVDSGESELLERFFDGIERFTPELVSWNGSGFDLPVMHYRCMLHGVRAARYWETGDEDSAFRYNNYLARL